MRAAIYNPYLDTLGGGERYTMAVADALVRNGYSVDVEWKYPKIKEKLEERFGVNLGGINIVPNVKKGDGYDVCFWVSDGSIPTLSARKNFLHFQIPFKNVGGKTLLNRMKLFRIKKIICNSNFTKDVIDREYGVKSVVLYPPVSVDKFKSRKKENIILSVGRFSQLERSKRQDVLVKAFKNFYDSGNKGWELVLIGGADVGAGDYVGKLKEMAKYYPVKILKSPSFKVVKDYYAKSKIFWTASGYGVDEKKDPQLVEHFGIAVVEAMGAGAVPFVYKGGGHKEIIKEGENGFLWESDEGLIAKTQRLMTDVKLARKLAIQGKKDAQFYSYERFEKEFTALL